MNNKYCLPALTADTRKSLTVFSGCWKKHNEVQYFLLNKSHMLFLVITCPLHTGRRFHSTFCKCFLGFAEINVSFWDFLRGDILIFQNQVGVWEKRWKYWKILKLTHFCFLVGGPQEREKTSFLSPDKFSKTVWPGSSDIYTDHLQAMYLMSIEPLLLTVYKSPQELSH